MEYDKNLKKKQGIFEPKPQFLENLVNCITQILSLEPEKLGKRECIHFILKELNSLIECESVQILEVLETRDSLIKLDKYYPESKTPDEVETDVGVNHYCIKNHRFFISLNVNHKNRIVEGLTGEIKGNLNLRKVNIKYIKLEPTPDEESVLFYPLIKNNECIGTIKLCDFKNPKIFCLKDLNILRPVAELVTNLLYLFKVIDTYNKQLFEYDTLVTEATYALDKLQVGERLTYQYLTATSHLHELAGLMGGMSSDREDLLSLVQTSNLSNNKQDEFTAVIERFSKQRKEAHKKLLSLLRDRPKQERLFFKPHNIKDLLNEQIEVYIKSLEQDNIRLRKSLKYTDIKLKVDASAFKYMIRILFNNAIYAVNKGTNRPKYIEMRSSRGLRNLIIRVIDNGIGIDRENQKNIFDAFYTDKDEGSGIGLYWAKKTIEEHHNGRLILEKSYLDKGSTFALYIPLMEAL